MFTRTRAGLLATASMAAILASFATGCTSEVASSAPTADAAKEDGRLEHTEDAYTGNSNWSWGVTHDSTVDINVKAASNTCFMTGISGNLRPGDDRYFSDGFHPASAGVRVNAAGNYEIFVTSTSNNPVQVWARCVNSVAGRTAEVVWQGAASANGTKYQDAVSLGSVVGGRRCFLTQAKNNNWVYNGDGSTGWYAFTSDSNDFVRIWHDKTNWWLGGSIAKGNVFITARCFTINEDDGVWGWQAGDPGTRKDPLTNVGGATCGLTGFGGHFDTYSDWNDGAFISYEGGTNQFYMNTKNGKIGEAQCMK